jgi:hypothetical protein
MQPIIEGLPLKRKRILTKWLRRIRPLPITDGKKQIGMVERWDHGMMGFGEERKYFLYVCP